jgi:hypothetical protein
MLERGDDTPAGEFDAYVITERAARSDQCEELRKRMKR